MTRGVIIAPKFTFDDTSLHFSRLVGIEPLILKHYLLYWDRIEYPKYSTIHTVTTADEQFLIDAGVLSRLNILLQGDVSEDVGFVHSVAQCVVFQLKAQQEPGAWTIGQSGKRVFFPRTHSTEEQAIEIELYRALPSPGDEVSLDDILAFKEKRRPELASFRTLIDQLYLEVIGAADIPRAKTVAIKRLENAIKDLHSVAHESWASKLVSSFRVELNIPSIACQALTGAGLATTFGVSPGLGAAIGAIGAAIKFVFALTPKPKGLPDNLKDYAYLNHIERELRS